MTFVKHCTIIQREKNPKGVSKRSKAHENDNEVVEGARPGWTAGGNQSRRQIPSGVLFTDVIVDGRAFRGARYSVAVILIVACIAVFNVAFVGERFFDVKRLGKRTEIVREAESPIKRFLLEVDEVFLFSRRQPNIFNEHDVVVCVGNGLRLVMYDPAFS